MYTIYALKSLGRKYIYVGMTDDINRRFGQHNDGKEATTKPYKPFIILYTETASTRVEARKREKYWKSGAGKKFLHKLAQY